MALIVPCQILCARGGNPVRSRSGMAQFFWSFPSSLLYEDLFRVGACCLGLLACLARCILLVWFTLVVLGFGGLRFLFFSDWAFIVTSYCRLGGSERGKDILYLLLTSVYMNVLQHLLLCTAALGVFFWSQ